MNCINCKKELLTWKGMPINLCWWRLNKQACNHYCYWVSMIESPYITFNQKEKLIPLVMKDSSTVDFI